MDRLWRDIAGSVIVEYSIVFPVFILVTLGMVDIGYMLADWAAANKAVYLAARTAIVSDPVAQSITDPQGSPIGQYCFNFSDGTSNGNCPSLTAICTGAAISGSCTCTGTGCPSSTPNFDDTSFTNIVARMHGVFCPLLAPSDASCPLKRENVKITYQTTGYGYAGQPGGLPLTVTVQLTNMTHQFYFIGPLMRFFGGIFPTSSQIPAFASTLTSEDMTTN